MPGPRNRGGKRRTPNINPNSRIARAAREAALKQLELTWSPYRAMWTLCLFDLPVKTKPQRKAYTVFRKHLLEQGLIQLQFSVYERYVADDEAAKSLGRRIAALLPEEGHVIILSITEKQHQSMQVFFGKKATDPPPEPEQLTFF
jgi:CRISPR-associated protein Cas2